MKLKIPPAIQLLIFALLMWIVKKATHSKHFHFEYQELLSKFIFVVAILLALIAIYSFKKAKTTVNPMIPSEATKLVVIGIYKVSRNPMYLSLMLVLIAFFIKLGNLYNITILILYTWYITEFQIKPEEKALIQIFGKDYIEYCKKVRRWL